MDREAVSPVEARYDEDATRAVSTVTELLDRLATDGPSEQELESITAMLAQQQELSAFKRGELTYLADAALFHEPLIPPSELRQTAADMGPAGLASMARSVKETLLVHVPPDAKVEANWLSRLDEWNAPGPETGHKVASLPGLPSSRYGEPFLFVDDDSLMLQDDERRVRITRESVVGTFEYLDGCRQLIDTSGRSLLLFPGRWTEEQLVFDKADTLAEQAPRMKAGVRFGPPPSRAAPVGLGQRPGWSGALLAATVVPFLFLLLVLMGDSSRPEIRLAIAVTLVAVSVVAGLANTALAIRTYRQVSEGPIRFDVATDRMSNPRAWHPGTPPARAYVIGGLVLAWLDRYGLLAEWVQGAAAEELQEMRSGDGRPSAAYRALDGILATDMMCSPGREFVTYLHSPRRGGGAGRIDQLHAKWKGDLDWYELEDTPDVVAGALDDLDKEYKEFRDAIWLYRRIHRRQWKLPPRAT